MIDSSVGASARTPTHPLATREPTSKSHDAWALSTLFRRSPFAWVSVCFGKKASGNKTTRQRVRATADVPILWADHAARQNVLSGMWKILQTSLEIETETGGWKGRPD